MDPQTMTKWRSLRMYSRLGRLGVAFSGLVVACGPAGSEDVVTDDLLAANDAFVAIPRDPSEARVEAVQKLQQGFASPAAIDRPPSRSSEFYLAINKNELEARWFMSGYLKQYFPGGVRAWAASSLGTRVVSFRLQNGKLFVFDVDDRKKSSDTFDPQVVVDAYPIITNYDAFNRLPNAQQYVLVDPSAGLNDFDVISDFQARDATPTRFKVELSFLQRFRRIADGVTFEEVFTGYSDLPDAARPRLPEPPVDPNIFRASGTLGIALRRYAEGEGFVPGARVTNPRGSDLYFLSDPRLVPGQRLPAQNAIKWNIKAGMTPIKWVISDKINAVQARYPQYDMIGAIKAGIENWNEVFAFPALEASVGTPDQSFADDDINYFIYDPDPSVGYAFADWRTNPNTGEVRGASVYFNDLWIKWADYAFEDDPLPAPSPTARSEVASLRWKPMPAQPLCVLEAPQFRSQRALSRAFPAGMTKKEKVEKFLTHVALHEIGHILGLRHNFKGSLVPPSSSVMDYLDDPDSIASSHPGSYDRAAIRFLYGLSPALPTDPFCNDDEVTLDTSCNLFDKGDPFEWIKPQYTKAVSLALAGGAYDPFADFETSNILLQFIRSGPTLAVRLAAFQHMIELVKVDPTRPAPGPVAAQAMDEWERRMLKRLFLDPDDDRGYFTADPDVSDPVLGPPLVAEIESVLLNRDGIRSYESRRAMVDILKKVQLAQAHRALRDAKTALEASRPTVPPDQAIDLDDLIARIERAISPYYD